MIAAIHQPQYLPWLGYFDKMARADVFCYLDTVQYKKNEWQNRNRIKTATGWQWITVPVTYKFPQKINEVKINPNTRWQKKHYQALLTNYRKTPYYSDYTELFERTYAYEWEYIADLNICLTEELRGKMGIHRPVCRSSDLDLTTDDPTGRLIEICRSLNADTYLAGAGGVDYMDLDQFRDHNINLIVQDFQHPIYPQPFGAFVSNLSGVDFLFSCGPDGFASTHPGML